MSAASGATLAIGSSIGRYTITRVLGEGGMGIVYEANHRDLGKRVALKTLHFHYSNSAEVRARFLREGQAASRIRHPHVVDVYDVGVEGNTPYLVMEFLEGEDLSKLLRREGALSVSRAVDLVLPAVGAVGAAHDLGIVHRDLKPDNIFICVERGTTQPKVVDFGISKLLGQDDAPILTGTDAVLGTPYYMSPEQAQGAKNIDASTDQYAIGVILYECVVGRKPFDEGTFYTLMTKIVNGDFPHPRTLVATIPEGLEAIILCAMAREPGQRFPSVRALGHALMPYASERARAVLGEEFAAEGATLPARPAMPSAPAGGDSAPVGHATTLGQSAQLLDARKSAVKPLGWLLLGGAALAVAASGAFLSMRGEPPPSSSAKSAEAPPSLSPSPPPPPSVEPVVVPRRTKRVGSNPPGATVFVDGKAVGPTPLELDMPDAGDLAIELRLPGRVPVKRTITNDDPPEVTVELPAEPKAPQKPKPRTERPGSMPSVRGLAPR